MFGMIKRMRGEQGFTLIELLVVIIIIGILLAVALPSFLGQTEKARVSAAKQELRQAYTAAKAYATENDGSFTDLNTEKLQDIEPSVTNVEVSNANGGDLTLTYTKSPVNGTLTVEDHGKPDITVNTSSN